MNEERGLGKEGRRVFGTVAGAVFVVTLDATVVIAAFPALRAHFENVAPATLAWVMNLYTIVYAALLVPMGARADRHGRRKTFMEGLGVFALASAACAISPNVGTLIAARGVQALGAALLTPAALALLLEVVPVQRRAVAVSLFGAVGALAAAFGPAIGSWLIDLTSWRSVFWINIPLCLWVAWLAVARLSRTKPMKEAVRSDWIGASLLTLGIALVIFGLGRMETGLGSTLGSGGLLIGSAVLALFVAWSRKREGAALDLKLFRSRNFQFANLATLVFGVCFSMMFLVFYLYMIGQWHYSQSLAGLAGTPGPLVVIVTAILSGRFAARHGHRRLLIAGGICFALAQFWFYSQLGGPANYVTGWLPGQLLSGAGIGLLIPSLSGAAAAGLPMSDLGSGNAANTAIRQMGGAMGIAITVAIVGRSESTIAQYQTVYMLLAAGGILVALLAIPINTRPPLLPPS